ncbi:MAG TPA: tetratricopeptide repeat protein [Terriglobales bacterium]|nr:tetratricopeptide repeat protein [Terriglobales bacterium]
MPSKFKFLVLALLLLSFSSPIIAQNQSQRQAIASALQNNAFPEALKLLEPALAQSPADAQLWAMQGAAYAGEHRNAEALSSYNKALTYSPDYLPALTGAIQIEFDAANAAAIPLLQRVLRLRPGDQTSHGMLAVLEYQQGNCAAAVPHFEKSGTLFDSRPTALHAYATCLVKLKQFDPASAVLQKSLAMNPENIEERRLLASVQLMANKPQEAIATLEPLLQTTNEDAATLELAASAYEDSGDTDKAVSTLRHAIMLDPQNVQLYLDFASLCFSHQSFQVGIDVVNDGIAQQPDSAQLYFARGVLYVQLADYDKAEADLNKAYELDPTESLTAAAQGLLAVQQNDLDRALSDVQQKLKAKPNDPLLLYLRADVLAQKGAEPGTPEFRTAVESARKAVALRPSLAPAHAVLAKLYMDSGQNQLAVAQCRKALATDPKDQTSLYRLIQGLRKTGKTAEIPDLLKRLAQLRQQDVAQQRQRYRYKVVEGGAQ